MNKFAVDEFFDTLKKNLPILYLIAVGLGMLFNYCKFNLFSINIFQYASVFDFLISPFEDLNILWFILVTPCFPLLAKYGDKYWEKHFPKSYKKLSFGISEKPWFRAYQRIVFWCVFIYYIFFAAFSYGWITKKIIERQEPIQVRYMDDETVEGKLIGKVGNTLFLLDGDFVRVIPLDGVVKEMNWPLSAE